MSLQFMPVAPSVAFLAIVAAAAAHGQFDSRLLAWVTADWLAVTSFIYYFALHEVYNHVRYVEIKLKPRVARILQLSTRSFWAWETHLKQLGKSNSPLVGDLAPAAVAAIAFVAAAGFAFTTAPDDWRNWIGVLASAPFVIASIAFARGVVSVRHEFEAAA
jgi:hypothetical protein